MRTPIRFRPFRPFRPLRRLVASRVRVAAWVVAALLLVWPGAQLVAADEIDQQAGKLFTTNALPAFTDDSSTDADGISSDIEPARKTGTIYGLNPVQR